MLLVPGSTGSKTLVFLPAPTHAPTPSPQAQDYHTGVPGPVGLVRITHVLLAL